MILRSCGLLALILILPFPGLSQSQWSWPDKPRNLRVLPSDFDGARLRPVMTGFTRALGVRCSYCHVGKEGEPLNTYDFASDANPNKERARTMLTMLADINDHLKKMNKSGDKPVNMWCHTCHHGRPKPMTLEEELGATYRSEGIESAVAQYSMLKDRFYGKGAYDFGERSLTAFGYEVLNAGDPAGAIKAFTLYAAEYPGSANAWDSLAEAYMKSGDMEKAKHYYKKSLELNPKNRNAQKMLEEMSKK